MTETKSLKKPWLLQALGFCFLIAPFGNILLSFISNSRDWYQPEIFFRLLASIPATEWVWLSMIFVCGVLLFIQHKLAWTAATITLILVLGINIYKSLTLSSQAAQSLIPMGYQIAISAAVTVGILMIVFYARYPYLDRRDTWFGKAHKRFAVHLKAQVSGSDSGSGLIVSLSVSGARLQWTQPCKVSVLEEITVEAPDLPISPMKARVVENTSEHLRVRFLAISKDQKRALTEWLEKKEAA